MITTPIHRNPNHDDDDDDDNNNKEIILIIIISNQMHALPGGDSIAGWVGRGSRPRTKKVVCKWGRESLCQERENNNVRFRYDLHSQKGGVPTKLDCEDGS